MNGLEKFKIPIIVIAVLAVGAAIFAITRGGGGGGADNDISNALKDVTSNNRAGDPEVPMEQRTGMAMGEKK